MIKRSKKYFLTALSLIGLSISINVKAADFTIPQGSRANLNYNGVCKSNNKGAVSIETEGKVWYDVNYAKCNVGDMAVDVTVTCQFSAMLPINKKEYTIRCVNQGSTGAGRSQCYICNATNFIFSSNPPCSNAVKAEIYDENECLSRNPTTCRLCNGTYKYTNDPNCQFLGSPNTKEACEAKNNHSIDDSGNSGGNGSGSGSSGGSGNSGGSGVVPVTPAPSDKGLSIADVTEEEDTSLKPPSRATNAATGACEDYVVTYEGLTRGKAINSSHSIYKYYSAKSNCTDNQGQEFVAFCMDPTLIGPGGSAHGKTMPTSANYQITEYLNPEDSDFAKGAIYIYENFMNNTSQSIDDKCAAEVAMRYLEFSVGGLERRAKPGDEYYNDSFAYANRTLGGTCGDAGLALYQKALEASAKDVSKEYGSAAAEIIPNINQSDDGTVSGYLEVVGPNGEEVGITSVECPGTLTCTASGNRIEVSGTLGCEEATLKAAIATTSDSKIKSVLLAEATNQSNVQRFILFQTGGPAAAGVSYTFTPSDNCADESGCKTDVDFTCAPAGSYDNPIILKEGTLGGGETNWATCVYNNTDPKGNTFNAMKNDYCVVSCTEEWDFRLPGNIQTVSGRNFSFIARIGAKRTCKLVGDGSGKGKEVITPVNYRRSDGVATGPGGNNFTSFAEDYYYWAKKMVDAYNEYIKEKARLQAIKDYLDRTDPDQEWQHVNTRQESNPTGYNNRCTQDPQLTYHRENSPKCYSQGADLTNDVANYLETKYFYRTDNQEGHIWDGDPTSDDLKFSLDKTCVTEDVSATYDGGMVTDLYTHQNISVSCTKTETETYLKYGEEEYAATIAAEEAKRDAAYNEYIEAHGKIEQILEMYNECTDWKNEYEFDPEIRFTYQEESYMDLIMKHQNKNFLINRTELNPESPRSSDLSLFDMEIAVGTPGADSDELLGGASASGLEWPTQTRNCSRGFGADHGMDIDDVMGVTIYAAAAGRVESAEWNDSYGYNIVIDHGNMKTRYAHLKTMSVAAGATVSAHQPIGEMGNTGKDVVPGCATCDGSHLHFEVIVNGQRVDPANYLDMTGASPKCTGGSGSEGGPVGQPGLYLNEVYTYGPLYNTIDNTGEYSGTIVPNTVIQATYGESEVEYKAEETEYRSGVYFYTTNPDGLVSTTKDEGNPNQTALGYVYPVSLNTPQGNYPYTLDFGYVGMYNDSNELGRIMGASNSSLLSGSAADYVCHYNVCDPTVEDCPPQMCDEYTDKNGQTHYYDREGNETDKKTHDEQCSDLSKSCTWQTDENGNDTFCDKSGNCSSDPSAYLRDCAKECTGYSLVSYENYTGAEVENSGRLQFLPKVISLNSLFPASNQTAIALNWQTDKAKAVQKQIEDAGESIFSEAQYEFELTPTAMANIRAYNKTQQDNAGGYADFTLTCNYNSNGKYGTNCHSNFLDSLASRGVTVIKRDSSFTSDDKGYSYK